MVPQFDKSDVETSIAQRFCRQVELWPDNLAVQHQSSQLSYQALNLFANRVANTLLACVADAECRVALLFPPSVESVVAHIGTLKAGKSCVALNPGFPTERLRAIVADAEADVVLCLARDLELARELGGKWQFALDDAPVSNAATTEPAVGIGPDTLANITYTSGSTGQPKGVMNTHRTLLHRAWCDTQFLRITATDRITQCYSLTFGAGLPDVLAALLNGAACFPLDLKALDLPAFTRIILQEGITILGPPIAAFRQFLQQASPAVHFPACRWVIVGGEALFANDVDAFRKVFGASCNMANFLAATEAQIMARFLITADTPLPEGIVPVGHAEQDKTLTLRDEAGQTLPAGVVGELFVSSPYLSRGYWRRPELNAEFFAEHEGVVTYRTRDTGALDERGMLRLHGRADQVIKLRGYRIDLTEIEAVLATHPHLERCAAAVLKDSRTDRKQLVALVQLRPGHELDEAQLKQLVGSKLPDYMVPARFIPVAALPLTLNGKLNRAGIAGLDLKDFASADESVPPGSYLERSIFEIWREVLGVERFGVEDDFSSLGGDSLILLKLAAELRKTLNREISVELLLQAPTIRKFARLLEQGGQQPISVVPLSVNEHRPHTPPLFCIYGLYLYKHLARALAEHCSVYAVFIQAEFDALNSDATGSNRRSVALPGVEQLAGLYLQQITSVQPHGPYQILGSSFGGLIAFEMARQLRARGEEVRLIALLDSFAPGFKKPVTLAGWARAIRDAIQRRLPLKTPPVEADKSLWDDLRGKLRTRAMDAYRPQPEVVDAILFKAEQPVEFKGFAVDTFLGWKSLINGTLSVEVVPGDHLSIIAPPHVQVFAERLRKYLHE